MTFKVLCVCLLVTSIQAGPQVNLDQRIEDIFKTVVLNNRGFGDIVEPEETIPPTERPQVITTGNNGQTCKCVPYHLCKPDTDRIVTSDSRFFPDIDVKIKSRLNGNQQVCRDALDVCCRSGMEVQQSITPPANVGITPPSPTVVGCGYRNVDGIDFSLKGKSNEAGFGEFPWVVAILARNVECLCAGSLIHPQIVLTGARCVFNLTQNALTIRAGEWDTQTTKERLPYQERGVEQVIIHHLFNPKTLANNIALVVLSEPFQLHNHINVVCLPQQSYASKSRNCFASGWGKDNFGQEGRYSVILKKVRLPMIPFHQCQDQLRKTKLSSHFVLDPSFVCAGGQQNQDTCQGDGGAPLNCPIDENDENRYYQTGIVAWGIGCNNGNPGVYTNVPLYRDWIDEHVRANSFDVNVYNL